MVMMAQYVRQQKTHRCKEQILDFVGEDKGGMILENSIETCILPGTLMQIFYINLLKTSTDVPLHLGHISNIITWFTRP